MGISFAETSEPTNALYKMPPDFNWNTLPSIPCIFKEPVDELEPVVVIDTSNNLNIRGNFCYLSDTYMNGYYWVTDRIYLGENRVEVHLKSDPLYTYRKSIENASGVVDKFGGISNNHGGLQDNTEGWLKRIDDGSLVTGASRSHKYYFAFENIEPAWEEFTNYLGPDGGTYILGVVGGNSTESAGMVNYYAPTSEQLNRFCNWLTSYDITQGGWFWKLFNNPIESIVSLKKVYCTVKSNGAPYIMFGSGTNAINTGVEAQRISQRVSTIRYSAQITEPLDNYRCYEPYATAKLYIPFIGFVPFDPSSIYTSVHGSSGANSDAIWVTCRVDVLTGAMIAKVSYHDWFGGENVLGYYTGNCSEDMPITANNAGLVLANLTGSLAKTGAGIATGSVGLTSAGLGQLAGTKGRTDVQGSVTGNAGALGPAVPFLTIERGAYLSADDYISHIGLGSNVTMRVANALNFIKFKELEKIDYTPTYPHYPTLKEREEIENYLRSGIVLPSTTRYIP